MSSCDWDLFLDLLKWAREETCRADRGVLKRMGLPVVSWVNYVSPWDTHYQFSIKTVLSKKEPSWGDTRCTDGALRCVAVEVLKTCPHTSSLIFGRLVSWSWLTFKTRRCRPANKQVDYFDLPGPPS